MPLACLNVKTLTKGCYFQRVSRLSSDQLVAHSYLNVEASRNQTPIKGRSLSRRHTGLRKSREFRVNFTIPSDVCSQGQLEVKPRQVSVGGKYTPLQSRQSSTQIDYWQFVTSQSRGRLIPHKSAAVHCDATDKAKTSKQHSGLKKYFWTPSQIYHNGLKNRLILRRQQDLTTY